MPLMFSTSLINDTVENVTLSEEVSTIEVTQGNLELPLPPNYLYSHQTKKQEDEIFD